MKDINYALFIMTYERAEILSNTISVYKSQTIPPQKILIVDNSESNNTKNLFETNYDSTVEYYRMGYNAGPAGAAKRGLEILTKQDYEWICWGDDDDPPRENDLIERIFSISNKVDPSFIGIMGTNGSLFDKKTGQIKRIKDADLKEVNQVDQIPGGGIPIVNSNVIKAGCLPDEKLFFGFEELDFCLNVQKHGFKNYINGEICLENRKLKGRLNLKKSRANNLKNSSALWREYYSIRNIIYILIVKEQLRFTALKVSVKAFLKAIYSLKYGIVLFYKYSKIVLRGIFDGWFQNMGKKEL